jgi:hypothetical protein
MFLDERMNLGAIYLPIKMSSRIILDVNILLTEPSRTFYFFPSSL